MNVKTFRQFLPSLGNSSKEPMNTPKSTFECKTGFVVNLQNVSAHPALAWTQYAFRCGV